MAREDSPCLTCLDRDWDSECERECVRERDDERERGAPLLPLSDPPVPPPPPPPVSAHTDHSFTHIFLQKIKLLQRSHIMEGAYSILANARVLVCNEDSRTNLFF
jgi:hypothetical protein